MIYFEKTQPKSYKEFQHSKWPDQLVGFEFDFGYFCDIIGVIGIGLGHNIRCRKMDQRQNPMPTIPKPGIASLNPKCHPEMGKIAGQ